MELILGQNVKQMIDINTFEKLNDILIFNYLDQVIILMTIFHLLGLSF